MGLLVSRARVPRSPFIHAMRRLTRWKLRGPSRFANPGGCKNELYDEKIDIVRWSPENSQFIAEALSPAKAVKVTINEEAKSAFVVVPDNQLSLAIGKSGQNVRRHKIDRLAYRYPQRVPGCKGHSDRRHNR